MDKIKDLVIKVGIVFKDSKNVRNHDILLEEII